MWAIKMLPPSRRGVVYYNAAAAAARKAVSVGAYPVAAAHAEGRAVLALQHSAIGGAARISAGDIADFNSDPDFASLAESEGFRRWTERFGPETSYEQKVRVWTQLASEVRSGARTAKEEWLHRSKNPPAAPASSGGLLRDFMRRLVPSKSVPLDRSELVQLFRHDELMWKIAATLAASPADKVHRIKFQELAAALQNGSASMPEPDASDHVQLESADQWGTFTAVFSIQAARGSQEARSAEERTTGSNAELLQWFAAAAESASSRWGAIVDFKFQ